MKKIIRTIENRVRQCDDRLHRKLNGLSSPKKLAVVLVLSAVFTLCVLFTLTSALCRIGKNSRQKMEIKHIKPIDLHQKQGSINLYKQ